ncbi:hypothetical protein AcW1_008750 [Taiwanofungus camphoratus]|nr:hypothetical protein AcW1_008750 [Antrodia cinnamomea]
MFVLSIVLTRGVSEHGALQALGLLQFIWLVRDHPALQDLIAQVEEPTMENLRTAGMFEISIVKEHGLSKAEDAIYAPVKVTGDE